ncbi:mechanosensitive ion channel domain-containing protein [Erythrobacter sp. HL-111]|uniref:mechanosensitive ion channel domain-containing protein n=1 Tax=Erythrobacter sp. HL-111 TaxID=1798193 RepID=UPI000A5074AB|nr:mechanosensitive ion channel domain-containing protein [Erythrobacter sp. HL-111]
MIPKLPIGLPLAPESSLPDVLASIALVAALVAVWFVTGRALKAKDDLPRQAARRWTANARNALLLIAVIGLLMIWAPQLRTFALSLTAVAVAIVVATKELILCLSGSAFRTFTRAYAIGDIIEIGSNRGEVVDINLLSTRLRELDRREGSLRSVGQGAVVPHSLLFTQAVRVLVREGRRPVHGFALTFETGANLFAQLDEIAERAAAALRAEGAAGAAEGSGEAVRVAIATTDLGRQRLEFELAAGPDEAARAERAVAVAVGSFVHELASAREA